MKGEKEYLSLPSSIHSKSNSLYALLLLPRTSADDTLLIPF
jgi:hypothetical protein